MIFCCASDDAESLAKISTRKEEFDQHRGDDESIVTALCVCKSDLLKDKEAGGDRYDETVKNKASSCGINPSMVFFTSANTGEKTMEMMDKISQEVIKQALMQCD